MWTCKLQPKKHCETFKLNVWRIDQHNLNIPARGTEWPRLHGRMLGCYKLLLSQFIDHKSRTYLITAWLIVIHLTIVSRNRRICVCNVLMCCISLSVPFCRHHELTLSLGLALLLVVLSLTRVDYIQWWCNAMMRV